MTQFRKKPVVIEAWKWEYDRTQEKTPSWVTDALSIWPNVGGIAFFPEGNDRAADGDVLKTHAHMIIHTLEGNMALMPGQWIIRGVKGELYPCKPDIFEMTYEPVT